MGREEKNKTTYRLIRPIEARKFTISKIITKTWAKGWHLYDTLLGKQRLKMLVLDLDGTALDDHKKFVPENIKAIQELKKENPDVVICIATGRGFHQALRFAKEIATDYFITDNGGAIYINKNNEYELADAFTMPEQESLAIYNKIAAYAKENPAMIWHFSTDNLDHNFIIGPGKDTFKKAHDTFYPGEIFGDGVLQVENFAEIKKLGLNNIIKICVDFGNETLGEKQYHDLAQYLKEKKINFFKTGAAKLEIAPADVDKGTATLNIIKKEQENGKKINLNEVLTLGNSDNDIPMFTIGCQSRCPSNAKEYLNVPRLKYNNNEPFIEEAINSF